MTICLFMFYSKANGKVVLHVVLKFKACYSNNVEKFWDSVETILYQKLKGQTGLLIDFSSFKFSGKNTYGMEWLSSFNLNMVFYYTHEAEFLPLSVVPQKTTAIFVRCESNQNLKLHFFFWQNTAAKTMACSTVIMPTFFLTVSTMKTARIDGTF